jgi:ribokinase
MKDPVVISLGSVNVDFQVRTDHWPKPGETVLGNDFLMISGGKAANIAYLARKLKVAAMLIARVGDDLLADRALEPLQRLGVDLAAVRRVADRATGVSLISVRSDGDKAIILAANANDSWNPDDERAVAEAISASPAGSVLAADLEVPVRIVRRALTEARAKGHVVVLDPSPANRMEPDLYGAADYLTPNNSEAEELTGISIRSVEDGFRAGEKLLMQGARTALVKLGAEGCVLSTSTKRLHIRPSPQRTVDATGAGDAFAGALAVALLERRPPEEAACCAVAAASIAVTRYGSQPSYPDRAEFERAVKAVEILDEHVANARRR